MALASQQVRPTCTNASQSKACASSFEEEGLDWNTVSGRFESSCHIGIPAVVPPNLVSQPRVLKSVTS